MTAPQQQEEPEASISANLGSDGGVSTQCFTIDIPNKDCDGQEIGNQRKWVLEAIRLLCEVNGGATAMPPVEGGWLNDQREIIRWRRGLKPTLPGSFSPRLYRRPLVAALAKGKP